MDRAAEATAGVKLQEDHWLGAMLGYPVFRVEVDLESAGRLATLARSPDAPRAMYYTKVATDQVELVRRLTAIGFSVIDTSLSFEWVAWGPRGTPRVSTTWPIRAIEAGEHEEVLSIAATAFRYSRFHLDPAIPRTVANATRREWVHSYIRKERGDGLYVALDGAAPVGFLAVLAADGERPRRAIDLIGVHPGYQRRGVGEALVRFFLELYGKTGARLEVGTQAANLPSIRLYEKLGFSVTASRYVLHLHVGHRWDGAA